LNPHTVFRQQNVGGTGILPLFLSASLHTLHFTSFRIKKLPLNIMAVFLFLQSVFYFEQLKAYLRGQKQQDRR